MFIFLKSQKIALSLALINLVRNKKRTALSLLGIVIGVMLVIVVLSLGSGMKEYVMDQVESFGSDIINVEVKVPGTQKTSSSNAGGIASGTEIKTLKLDDAEDIAKLNNLGGWYAGALTQTLVSFKDENESVMTMAVTSGIFEIDKNMKIEKGIRFNSKNDQSIRNEVILGYEIAQKLFKNREALGEKVRVNNQKYLVKGILEKRGATGFFDFDSIVYIPAKTAQANILSSDHFQWIVFKSLNPDNDPLTIRSMEKILRKNHDIENPEDDDFAITSMAEATEMIDDIFIILNLLLIGLTSISLVVGGVGIMNVMYVAVTERVFEIGLRKAIGAKKGDILMQFIYESIILTMIGGIIGIILGFLISKITELVASKFNFFLEFPVSGFSVLLAIGFSMFTGIIFGYKPAKKAADLTPIEALNLK